MIVFFVQRWNGKIFWHNPWISLSHIWCSRFTARHKHSPLVQNKQKVLLWCCNKSLKSIKMESVTDYSCTALPINLQRRSLFLRSLGRVKEVESPVVSLDEIRTASRWEIWDTLSSWRGGGGAWTKLSGLIYMQAESELPRVCLAWLSSERDIVLSAESLPTIHWIETHLL